MSVNMKNDEEQVADRAGVNEEMRRGAAGAGAVARDVIGLARMFGFLRKLQ